MNPLFLITIIFLTMNLNACTAQKEPFVPITNDSVDTETSSTLGKIKMTVGNHTFAATLYNNATAKAFKAMLPMRIKMDELNGNEKYYYLPDDLPTATSRPKLIKKGDLMLFASNCLVVFYKTFATSYPYSKIGFIENAHRLEDALGNGDIMITFE